MNNADFIVANSSSYTHEYSQFPYSLITQHHFKDADNTVASLINKINTYTAQGDLESASKLAGENADIIKHYVIDATFPNTVEEEIRNVQVMALQKHQCVHFDTEGNEPEIIAVGDIWEGGLY